MGMLAQAFNLEMCVTRANANPHVTAEFAGCGDSM
jgi:hypothetical protein